MRFAAIALVALAGNACNAQLGKWLVRETGGEVHVVDFGTPVPTVGPAIAGMGTGGEEDVNLMTDATGAILFSYAVDGADLMAVRDAGFNAMPNGSGLLSSCSGLESCIAPVPCQPQHWFIVHRQHQPTGGALYYSEVDLALNGGLGDITATKNQLIATGITEGFVITRPTPNGTRWLFMCRMAATGYEVLRAPVTNAGIGAPVPIASVPMNSPPGTYTEMELTTGMDRLALSLPGQDPADPDIMQWDLDLSTGQLMNAAPLMVSSNAVFGIEYSPLDGWLYYLTNGTGPNLELGRISTATFSMEVIAASLGPFRRGIEEAANGRIYCGGEYYTNFLAEVADPDAPPLSPVGFTANAVLIANGGMRPGLPNAIEGELPGAGADAPPVAGFSFPEPACVGAPLSFTNNSMGASGFEWQFGDGAGSSEEEPTHGYGASGDYPVQLIATNSCSSDTLLQTIAVHPVPTAAFTDSVHCDGTVILRNASIGAAQLEWDLGDGTAATDSVVVHVFGAPGTYAVALAATSADGCSATTMAFLTVPAQVHAAFTYTVDPCDGVVRFHDQSEGASAWHWTFDDGSSSHERHPAHGFAHAGAHSAQLVAYSAPACSDTMRLILATDLASMLSALYVPNAFTPNGDEHNDVLEVQGMPDCFAPSLDIFDRWGGHVFHASPATPWDGADAPTGVYVYLLSYQGAAVHGHVVLLR